MADPGDRIENYGDRGNSRASENALKESLSDRKGLIDKLHKDMAYQKSAGRPAGTATIELGKPVFFDSKTLDDKPPSPAAQKGLDKIVKLGDKWLEQQQDLYDEKKAGKNVKVDPDYEAFARESDKRQAQAKQGALKALDEKPLSPAAQKGLDKITKLGDKWLEQQQDLYDEKKAGKNVKVDPDYEAFARESDKREAQRKKITAEPDGDRKQENASKKPGDGVKIPEGVVKPGDNVVSASDGSKKVERPDGSSIIFEKDGRKIEIDQEGNRITTLPDGRIYYKRDVKIPDGVVKPGDNVIAATDGSKKIDRPDGSSIIFDAASRKIETDPNGDQKITMPDRTVIYKEKGRITKTISPDGKSMEYDYDSKGNLDWVKFPNGAVFSTDDGKTWNKNVGSPKAEILNWKMNPKLDQDGKLSYQEQGNSVERFPEGIYQYWDKNTGFMSKSCDRDGNWYRYDKNGRQNHVTRPDGSELTSSDGGMTWSRK